MTDSPGAAVGPDFVCIGAQKAGTTWLYHSLRRHGSVWMPPLKELHFFDLLCAHRELLGVESGKWPSGAERLRPLLRNPSLSTARWLYRFYGGYPSTEWYYRLFSDDFTEGRLTGDITPAYSTLDYRGVAFARRVLSPECTVLLIVRNPIERFWSSIKMLYRWKGDRIGRDTCREILSAAQEPRHRLRGDYLNMIRRWRTHFGQRFHVLLFDELREDSEGFLREVLNLLGLDPQRLETTVDDRVNADPARQEIPDELKERVMELYGAQIEALDEELPGVAERWLQA